MNNVGRGICGGLIWLGLIFVGDTIDSAWMLDRSMSRIRTDEVTTTLLRDGVIDYVVRMAAAHLLLAILAGITLILALRIWFPQEPENARASWKAMVGWAAVVTLIGNLRQMITFPTLHDWFPWRARWIDTVELWMIDLTVAVLAIGWLFFSSHQWAGSARTEWLKRVGVLLVWLGFLAMGLRNPAPQPARVNAGPNLLFIGIDALRPDHLGFHGYDRDTSPNIDALLEESVVFESAWSPLARTYPAWVSILTGSLPLTHGVRDNLPEPGSLVPEQALIPQVMRDAGWHTAFVTDDSRFSYMVPETGFSTIIQPLVGLQNFAVSVNEPRYRAFHGLLYNPLGFALVPSTSHNQAFGKSYHPDLFVDRAVDALGEMSQQERFFMAIHSCVLHAPGDRVWPWYHMHGQRGYEGPNRFRYSRSGTMLIVEEEQEGLSLAEVNEQDVRIYDSGIDMADQLVGDLVAELKASGLWDNTVVVLFSDHGEALWNDDLPYKYTGPNHGFHAYDDGQFNVALAIRFPDGAHAGELVSAPVRLIDLAPTIAEYFELEWPNPVDGLSLSPLIEGETEDSVRPVFIETGLSEPRYWRRGHLRYPFKQVSERYQADSETGQVHIRSEFKPHLIAAKDRIFQFGDWKLVWLATTDGEHFELYNRAVDPLNLNDLALRRPRLLALLKEQIRPYLARDGIEFSAAEIDEAQQDSETEPDGEADR